MTCFCTLAVSGCGSGRMRSTCRQRRVIAKSGRTSGQRSANQPARTTGNTASRARSARTCAIAIGRLPARSSIANTNTTNAAGRFAASTASATAQTPTPQPSAV
jgi:hypothetical protein